MTIETALHNLKELHDNIKEHPYWISFKHGMLKQDVIPMYLKVMGLYSYLRFQMSMEKVGLNQKMEKN